MILASILFLGLVQVGPGDVPGRASLAMPGHFGTLEALPPAWDRAAHPRPARGGRRAILDCEESEEDPSDDSSPDAIAGFLALSDDPLLADPLARRGAGPFSSRSASPTLRLRC